MFKNDNLDKDIDIKNADNSPSQNSHSLTMPRSISHFSPKSLINPPEAICWSDTPIMYEDYLKNNSKCKCRKRKKDKQNDTIKRDPPQINKNENEVNDFYNDELSENSNDSNEVYENDVFEPPGDNITQVENIMIGSGALTPDGQKSHAATLKGLELPCSESIYEKPKFETHVDGNLDNYFDKTQHAFIGLRYTSFNPQTRLYSRRLLRVGLGPSGEKRNSALWDDGISESIIGTQTPINYSTLNKTFKAIPSYFQKHNKYVHHSLFKQTSWNCNRFVYHMAKAAGVKDIARFHNTYSAIGAGKNILKN